MPKPSCHVIFGSSGAGTLKQLLWQKGRAEQVVCPLDDFSFGPIANDDAARTMWVEEELGFSDWGSVVVGTPIFLRTSCAADISPIVWISRRDARSYAGFLWWLSVLGDAPCSVIDITDMVIDDRPVASLSQLSVEAMAPLLDTEIPLTSADRRNYQEIWHLLKSENAPLRIIGHSGALESAPITHFDSFLIAGATTTWRKMARIVGEALAMSWDGDLHQVGDHVLFGRLGALAESGVLEWRGDLSSMQRCELRLPITSTA